MDAEPTYKKPALIVGRAAAQAALDVLLRARALDPSRAIERTASHVTFPLLPSPDLASLAARAGGDLVEAPLAPRAPRRTPHQEILARLPAELAPHVPDKWEKLGDVVVVRIPDALRPHAREVAAAFAAALGARCVVEDTRGVEGELREMRGVVLHGEDPVTTHVENGILYRFDASRIMFSSGNVAERTRAASLRAPGETIVDMFAGIGYFTLPIARSSGAARIVAIEKNSLSHRYLVENVRLNGVEAIVEPWLGDNRDHPDAGFADRVLMGYFPGTATFLPTTLRFLRPEGGVVHYHDVAPAESWRERLVTDLRTHARDVSVLEARVVKSYAPGIVHALVVARVAR